MMKLMANILGWIGCILLGFTAVASVATMLYIVTYDKPGLWFFLGPVILGTLCLAAASALDK